MLNRRYLSQKERDGYWHRVALEREATQLIRSAARRAPAPVTIKPKPTRADMTALPRRLTLSDLPSLRKKGLVP
jgi:hypothetical protein